MAPIGAEKSVTEIYFGEKEKLTNKGKRKHLNFHLHSTLCTQNFKTLAQIEAEKSVTEISIGEKEK